MDHLEVIYDRGNSIVDLASPPGFSVHPNEIERKVSCNAVLGHTAPTGIQQRSHLADRLPIQVRFPLEGVK